MQYLPNRSYLRRSKYYIWLFQTEFFRDISIYYSAHGGIQIPKQKPVIGIQQLVRQYDITTISARLHLPEGHEAAGGLSILLPPGNEKNLKQLSKLCDGFPFSWRPDIHPFLSEGGNTYPKWQCIQARDSLRSGPPEACRGRPESRCWESAAESDH